MMRRAAFVALLFVVAATHPFALAQEAQQPTEGDGGLHVSDGGMFAGIGGSGSFSGTVRGPGGGGGVTRVPAPGPAVVPNATGGGAVTPASVELPKSEPVSAPAPDAGPLGPILAVALVAVAAAVLFLRPVRQPG